jgi:hypothetical protein
VVIRSPTSADHEQALAKARATLRELAVFPRVSGAVGEHAEAVTLLLLALADRLPVQRREEIVALAGAHDASLAGEIENLRAQLGALWIIGRDA